MATETRGKTNGAPAYGPLQTEEHFHRDHQHHPLGSVFRQVLDALTCAPKENRLKHATVVHLRDVKIGRIRVHKPAPHAKQTLQKGESAHTLASLSEATTASLETASDEEPLPSFDFEDVEVGEVTYLQKPKEPEPTTNPVGGGN